MIMLGMLAQTRVRRRAGITLTEILIAIMIMGVGLVSLATLFPIGLLRLRDANRWSRSAILTQSAGADATARGLLSSPSFFSADSLNYFVNTQNPPYWYATANSGPYNPLTQDTPSYYGDWLNTNNTPPYVGAKAWNGENFNVTPPNTLPAGGGLPFAYDPLWRYQTVNPSNTQANGNSNPPGGYYMGDTGVFEARFGYGVPFIRPDSSGGGSVASAWGLQRLTNFNRPTVMPTANSVPSIFVSPEDTVWVEAVASNSFSPVLPDLSISGSSTTTNDWRYTWMFTGQLVSANNNSCFDGNIVIFENRPFGISTPGVLPNSQGGILDYQVDGETVVEAIFGYSTNVNGGGYGIAADRAVLLRWSAQMPDPVVRAGDWIADVTYERSQLIVQNRWWAGNTFATGSANPNNNGEWDNLPAQRCFWYQVQKANPASPDAALGAGHRSMMVYVNQSLRARTTLDSNGNPIDSNGKPGGLNAALIAPNVVNVIPITVFAR
jgi:type II secretory pathway pseudopilin PulG